MSTTYKRHAERARTCSAKVLRKAGTDPLEKRSRRRTEADDAEQFSPPSGDRGVLWKRRECQTRRTCVHCHHERRQIDAHLQTSAASHTSVVELERSAVAATILRCMRSLTEDGHAGIDVRATSNARRSSSAPREHMICWVRRAPKVVTLRLLCKDDSDSQGTV